jgi:inhibitor of cysteine peptidase
MVISLDANPTTGYQWGIDGALPEQLAQVGDAKYASDSKAIGSGGTEVWTFAGQGSGEGTLKLKYWRSFEPTAAPADTFVVKVTVK